MHKNKFTLLIVVIIVIIALPITVLIAQKQQEVRQRADTKIPVFIAYRGNTHPISGAIGFPPTGNISLEVFLDGSSSPIRSFQINISWGDGVILESANADNQASFRNMTSPSTTEKTIGLIAVGGNENQTNKLLKVLSFDIKRDPNFTSGTNGSISFSVDINANGVADNQTPSVPYAVPVIGGPNPPPDDNDPPPDDGCKKLGICPTNSPGPTAKVSGSPNPSGFIPTGSINPNPSTPPGDDGGTGKHTRFDITLALQAIGELTQGNKDPKHKQRQVRIELFNKNSTKSVITKVGTINYESATGLFRALVDMGNVPEGDYTIKIKPIRPIGYLRKIVPPGVIHIAPGTTNKIPTGKVLVFIVGDLNLDNALDIQDYNIYISCFGEKLKDKKSCKDKEVVDLNDDGKTDSSKDLTDYKWLFNSFQNQYGD